MVEVKNLKKIFKLSKKDMKKEKTKQREKIAVDGLSFKAEQGQIFGLLGPNGAGKTTTLRCISTLIKPTEGEINVEGIIVEANPEMVRKKICFLTNELKLDTHFTPAYTIEYFGKLHGMDTGAIYRRKEELFKRFGVSDFENMAIGELSTGMKQKLSIAISLVHDPKVIIFDEPTNGLDIITAKSVTDYLLEMKEVGKTVIISTHIMDVAEKLCDKIAIMLDGKLSIEGTTEEICRNTGQKNLEEAFFKLYFDQASGGAANA
ncbi:ABC transporter ATP-binding protein [Alkalibacter saccharofermentans]|uniref:Sodium transport system ATP-binding protein n=1 Tax=Alkalibacter saccharofermentans DSM 14828 TaxID=1120975 RepID=A0A1M4SHB6_9FIRM|nr:ABC transporter ATP-binding protein [Alkalibacter saccharofermentans]SHE31590.1 sodium transport system ATP-binding protein [Alkalibacter saccharofermentans DSM 14828]